MGDADRLVLEGMEFFGHHGDLEAERELGSRIYVDVEIGLDLSIAGESDRLDDTLDYVRCFELVRNVVERAQHRLLEAVAARIADALLGEPQAQRVCVRVAKQPPIPGGIERVAVVVERARAAGAA